MAQSRALENNPAYRAAQVGVNIALLAVYINQGKLDRALEQLSGDYGIFEEIHNQGAENLMNRETFDQLIQLESDIEQKLRISSEN